MTTPSDRTVSRHGLTRCPHCHTFVRADDAECFGCGGALAAEGGALAALRRGFARTRGGLVAASLLGLATLSGCGDSSGKPPTDGRAREVAPDIGAQPTYGIPPQLDASVDKSTDIPAAPAYGIPPQLDAGSDTD